jgi:hypothetical protein
VHNGENPDTWSVEKLRRKADQAWDMAGLARQDRDKADEQRRTAEARDLERRIRERYQ